MKIGSRRNLKEFVDYDYTDKLSAEELKWLRNFNDTYYNGLNRQGWDKEALKASYLRNNLVNKDLMSNGQRSGLSLATEEFDSGEHVNLGEWLTDRHHFDAIVAIDANKVKSSKKGNRGGRKPSKPKQGT